MRIFLSFDWSVFLTWLSNNTSRFVHVNQGMFERLFIIFFSVGFFYPSVMFWWEASFVQETFLFTILSIFLKIFTWKNTLPFFFFILQGIHVFVNPVFLNGAIYYFLWKRPVDMENLFWTGILEISHDICIQFEKLQKFYILHP